MAYPTTIKLQPINQQPSEVSNRQIFKMVKDVTRDPAKLEQILATVQKHTGSPQAARELMKDLARVMTPKAASESPKATTALPSAKAA